MLFSLKHKSARLFVAVLASMLLLIGCELLGDDLTVDAVDVDVASYDAHIQPLFNRSCVSCHGGASPRAGLSLETWENLLDGSDLGEAMVAYAAERSPMIRLMERTNRDPHPDGRFKLAQGEIDLLKKWIDSGARGPLDQIAFGDATDLIYVAHEAEPFITIIDPDRQVIARELDLIELGFTDRARARHFAVEHDGSFWYASIGSVLRADPHWVVKFSRDNQIVSKIQIQNAGQLLVHPDKDILYVTHMPWAQDDARSLIEVRRSDLQAIEVSVGFKDSYAIALRPQGDFVFTSSMDVDHLMIVNVNSKAVEIFPIRGIKHEFSYFAMAAWGIKMWGSALKSGTITKFTVSNPGKVVQNHSLWVGADPRQITYSPDGKRVYVAVRNSNRLVVLDAIEEIIERTILHPAMQFPVGVSITADGKFLFVSSENELGVYESRFGFAGEYDTGTIAVFDTETLEVVKVIETQSGAAAMGSSVVVPLTTR